MESLPSEKGRLRLSAAPRRHGRHHGFDESTEADLLVAEAASQVGFADQADQLPSSLTTDGSSMRRATTSSTSLPAHALGPFVHQVPRTGSLLDTEDRRSRHGRLRCLLMP
ncbi:hypothetical protein AQJ91_20285 [Streptomyces dysideae]|uniref:Uncharacterized protein n=1 Tax=Streptomyces dysideae TaxID=909626 RepID=A0A101UYT1_9ACTN|nr:hypothetical protein AQJ91_20285 [Streptomyces dysideae]